MTTTVLLEDIVCEIVCVRWGRSDLQ